MKLLSFPYLLSPVLYVFLLLPESSSSETEPSYVGTFMKSITEVSEKITKNIPNWHNYMYDDFSETSINNGGRSMFDGGNKVKYVLSQGMFRSTPVQYGKLYRVGTSFEFLTQASHPFFALMWVRNDNPTLETRFGISVESELNSNPRNFSGNVGSIASYSLNITYEAFQTYGRLQPSVVEIFFTVSGSAWKSSSGDQLISDLGVSILHKQIEVFDTSRNVLAGYMLLSTEDGSLIKEEKIQETMKFIIDSFDRVLCNPNEIPCDENKFDCRCGKDIYRLSYPERHCILKSWRCDGAPDCPDGRDEENCLCEEGFFQCAGCNRGGTCEEDFHCIPNTKICDGVDDCKNFKDERTNHCAFTCSSNETVRLSKQCDGRIDCTNANDERGCTNTPKDRTNRCACNNVNNFTCSGEFSFYSDDERCDGKKVCSDFSDERNCGKCPEERPIPCACNNDSFSCNKGAFSCFSKTEMCDRIPHCGDGTDEAGCTTAACSAERPIACACNTYQGSTCTGEPCYSERDRCDGWMDCSDWSDEKNCSCPSDLPLRCACAKEDDINCTASELFQTSSRTYGVSFSCYSEWDDCDGMVECTDDSDELCVNCSITRPHACACKASDSCDGGDPCYSESDLCNESFQCSDHSDEWDCNCTDDRPLKCPCKNLQSSNVCTGVRSCYTKEELCNEEQNCENWGDEYNCNISNAGVIKCGCNAIGNVSCIGKPFFQETEKCDGKLDCSDGKDEESCQNCPTTRPLQCACNQVGIETCDGKPPCYNNDGLCDGINDCGDWSDEWNCPSCPPSRPHRCNCSEDNNTCSEGPQCFRDEDACDGKNDCMDGTDEMICETCPPYRPNRCECQHNFTCNGTICYSDRERWNHYLDCEDGSDEWGQTCDSSDFRPCNCKSLRNARVCVGVSSCYYTQTERCNLVFECPDKSDEWNCDCEDAHNTIKCACKSLENENVCIGRDTCFSPEEQCNAKIDCVDKSDELNCTCDKESESALYLPEYESGQYSGDTDTETSFTCGCFSLQMPSCSRDDGCIPQDYVNNGKYDCDDGSDEPHVISRLTTSCESCRIIIYRLNNSMSCDILGPNICDNSTCITVPALGCSPQGQCNETNFICVSPCEGASENCKSLFQCQDQSMILGFRFCDGAPHCADGSDEIKDGFGFKCNVGNQSSISCILPQWNLYDGNSTQCFKEVDACSSEENKTCFQCVDNKLKISSNQVCDGIINCYDASDECLCRSNFLLDFCQELFLHDDPTNFTCGHINENCVKFTASHIIDVACATNQSTFIDESELAKQCNTKFGSVIPTYCDGRPECDNLEDECEKCDNKPVFCQSLVEGQCGSFFRIGDRYCDGIEDEVYKYLNHTTCPKGFDEKNCKKRHRCPAGSFVSIDIDFVDDGIVNCDDISDEDLNIFSSSTEMIASPVIRYFIWIIAFITLFGNAYVFTTTTKKIRKKRMQGTMKCNHFLIVNLAVADFIMGIYLIFISINSTIYSGNYGKFDFIWRASAECSAAGSLAIISSETSCFLMSTLTTFRLVNVLYPVRALHASIWPWYLLVGFVWLFSILLAVVPSFPTLSDYFVYLAHFDSLFTSLALVNKSEIISFACRHATLSNFSLADRLTDESWESISLYLAQTFPNYGFQTVGYYGETSLCMPRFYVDLHDPAWRFSTFIITINFISFMYVCAGYVALYKISSNRPIDAKKLDAANTQMQKRIARLLVTDFLCWIPVCIIAYIKLGTGFYLSNNAYSFTIAFLLPINSALNPLLYSSFFDKILDKYICRKKEKKSTKQEISLVNLSSSTSSRK